MFSASRQKNLLVVPLQFFGSTSTISRFGERFRDGQYNLVSLLFAVLLLMVSSCHMESAPLARNVGGQKLLAWNWVPKTPMNSQGKLALHPLEKKEGIHRK